MLLIFSGLPGVGKTTLAKELARQLGAIYLRADTIEQAMREAGWKDEQIGGVGYMIGYEIASENLKLGRIVVADSVNPWDLTRKAWRNSASRAGSPFLEIEVICSDLAEHRRRVETRNSDIDNLKLPTWTQVIDRDYQPWQSSPLVIDTSGASPVEAVELIKKTLNC